MHHDKSSTHLSPCRAGCSFTNAVRYAPRPEVPLLLQSTCRLSDWSSSRVPSRPLFWPRGPSLFFTPTSFESVCLVSMVTNYQVRGDHWYFCNTGNTWTGAFRYLNNIFSWKFLAKDISDCGFFCWFSPLHQKETNVSLMLSKCFVWYCVQFLKCRSRWTAQFSRDLKHTGLPCFTFTLFLQCGGFQLSRTFMYVCSWNIQLSQQLSLWNKLSSKTRAEAFKCFVFLSFIYMFRLLEETGKHELRS